VTLRAASICLPKDTDGFVRRECPECERTFKMRPLPSDPFSVHLFLARQAGQVNADELSADVEVLTCIHCGHATSADEWLTDEQQQFLAEPAGSAPVLRAGGEGGPQARGAAVLSPLRHPDRGARPGLDGRAARRAGMRPRLARAGMHRLPSRALYSGELY
jgi:hypothetical protein